MQEEQVIIVNEKDEQIGLMPKLEAHQKGVLHRAFSVFLFTNDGKLLMQQRAMNKYHSAGLWTNTCCSHPLPNEAIEHAAIRRLHEEMGLEATLDFLYAFIYKAHLTNDLIEHEYDHVFIGYCDSNPIINTSEVADWKYIEPNALLHDIKANPFNYTAWFQIAIEKVLSEIKTKKHL